jgi:hypothetical protein
MQATANEKQSAPSAERKKKEKLSVLCGLNDPEQRRGGVGGKKTTNEHIRHNLPP